MDIPEWDISSMTKRYILEQEVFPVAGHFFLVAGNISCGRNYFMAQKGKHLKNIPCSKKYFLHCGIFPALDDISWGILYFLEQEVFSGAEKDSCGKHIFTI